MKIARIHLFKEIIKIIMQFLKANILILPLNVLRLD